MDKLDTLSKWVVVPRLVSGYKLQKDRAPYAALKALIAARNRIVHSKSEPVGCTVRAFPCQTFLNVRFSKARSAIKERRQTFNCRSVKGRKGRSVARCPTKRGQSEDVLGQPFNPIRAAGTAGRMRRHRPRYARLGLHPWLMHKCATQKARGRYCQAHHCR